MNNKTDDRRNQLIDLTVKVVLEIRAMYFSKSDANALKHWQLIHDRLRMAARTCTSVAEWATQMQQKLQLPTPSSSLSSAIDRLAHEVQVWHRGASGWLDIVEREHAYVMALCRLEAEDRRAQRTARSEATIDPNTGEVMP